MIVSVTYVLLVVRWYFIWKTIRCNILSSFSIWLYTCDYLSSLSGVYVPCASYTIASAFRFTLDLRPGSYTMHMDGRIGMVWDHNPSIHIIYYCIIVFYVMHPRCRTESPAMKSALLCISNVRRHVIRLENAISNYSVLLPLQHQILT